MQWLRGVFTFCSVFVAARADGVNKRFTSNTLISKTKPVLWVGALILVKDNGEPNTIIPVTLIADQTGVADARRISALNKYDMAKSRNSTRVMFSTSKVPWYAKVLNYSFHPDFIENTLSTLALLSLEYEPHNFDGDYPRLPVGNDIMSYQGEQLLTIGYNDRNGVIEQFVHQMVPLFLGECQAFYIVEDLDSKWLQPKHYHCYNVNNTNEKCVYDPGMPLGYFSSGRFILIGFSVWGPGCSLPSRYLDVEQFLPWIMPKMPSRRLLSPVVSGYGGPRHEWIVERLHPSKELALIPLHLVQGQTAEEIVYGSRFAPRKELIYRDVMVFKTGHGLYNKQQAIAVYALALYDTNFNKTNYTCVIVSAHCRQKSNSILEFTKSIDDTISPFKSYVKTVPIHSSEYKQLHTIQKSPEDYEVLGSDVSQLIFRFEFEEEAEISVTFYGNRTMGLTTTMSTTTTKPTKPFNLYEIRERRPYKTSTKNPHRPFIYYNGFHWSEISSVSRTRSTTTPTISTTTRTKRTRTTRDPYWWNKWWTHHNISHYRG